MGLSISSSFAAGEKASISSKPYSIIKNDPAKVLELIEKSRKDFSYLIMTGIDPTREFMLNRKVGDSGAVHPGVAFINDRSEYAILDIPLFPHSIEQNPNNLNHIMLIPRRAHTCIEYDVIENKIISEFTLSEKKFYGHGCYVPGTDLFYASTFLNGLSDGSVVLYDLKTKKKLKEIEVEGGAGAHQCVVSRDKKYIIMSFAEATPTHKPSMIWFDIKTGDIVKRIYGIGEHSEHFSELSDNYLIYTGGIAPEDNVGTPANFGKIDPNDKAADFIINEKDMINFNGQGIGIVGLESKAYSIVGNSSKNLVYFFNYKTGVLVKKISIIKPRGIIFSNDKKFLYVTSLPEKNVNKSFVTIIDLETLSIVKTFDVKNALVFGSHATKYFLS